MENRIENIYLAKQPIFDNGGKTSFYELLYRDADDEGGATLQDKKATARVITYMLNYLVVRSMVGSGSFFVNLSHDAFLDKDIINVIPSSDFILELKGDVELSPEIVTAAKIYKSLGYRISIDNLTCDKQCMKNLEPLYEQVAFFKIDMTKTSKSDIPQSIGILKKKGASVIAEKVESEGEYEFCRECNFDYFQGYFFQKPKITSANNISPNAKSVFEINRVLDKEPETEQIVQAFRSHPDLVINLLQFVNSAGMSSKNRIGSISQAINFIGRKSLKSWLLLLLYSDATSNCFSKALLESSLFRAKKMQLIAQKIEQKELAEKAFLVGIISNLDSLFKMKMEDLLNKTHFEEDIKNALINQQGALGDLLKVAINAEKGDFKEVMKILAKMGMDTRTFAQILTESISWTTQQIYHFR